MKVLLVNPGSDNAFTKVGFIVPPLGLAYIGAALRLAGHEVAIYDFNVEDTPPDYKAYRLVGVSGDTSRHKGALSIARDAKAAGALVAMGGVHATFIDTATASEPYVDFVVRGEGEETTVELADALENNTPLDQVEGLTFMDGGRLVKTPDRAPFVDIDNFPLPARDLLKMERYRSLELAKRKVTSVVSSRGCPSACSFCSSSRYWGRKWRARSVEGLLAEIRLIVNEYGFGGIAFVDDNFTLDPRRVVALCKAIIDEGIDIKWWCFSRVDAVVKNPEMVSFMGRAGCRYVFMGVESAHQTTLDAYSKKTSSEAAKEAVKLLKKNGIETLAAYILGAPDETRSMVEDTVKLSIKLDTGGAQYTLLTPFPGTAMYDELKDRLTTSDWDRYDCTHAVVRSDYLKPEELEAMLFGAYKSFYLRPKRLLISMLSAIRGRGVKLSEVKRLIENFR